MIRIAFPSLGLLVLTAGGLATSPANAAESKTFGDLSLGASFGTNPLLQLGGKSSASVNASAFLEQLWRTETGTTTISALINNSTYFRQSGSKQVYTLNASTMQAVSPTVTVNAGANFAADIGGQLGNRFSSAPDTGPPEPTFPPPDVDLPDYVVSAGRQYRINGQLGASFLASPRDSLTLSSRVQNIRYTGASKDRGLTSITGAAGFNRRLSDERQIGASLSAQHISYKGGGRANVLNPAVLFSTRFSQRFSATLGAGLLLVEQRIAGLHNRSASPSFSATLCGEGEHDHYCLSAARDAQAPSAISSLTGKTGSAVSTRASLTYARKIAEKQTIQASFSGVRTSQGGGAGDLGSTYLNALAGYDRGIGMRLSTGINLSARKLIRAGDDPKEDLSASIYLRYRIGDLL